MDNLAPKKLPKTHRILVLLLVMVFVLGLAGLVSALAVDMLYPGGVNAMVGQVPINPTERLVDQSQDFIPTASPTPFKPLPTSTITPTPSPTPTWTATASPTNTPPPTLTPTIPLPPTDPPPSPEEDPPTDGVIIDNIIGFPQTFNLSCESRSAVDWARYFGISIGEIEFLYGLPQSDDPNQGFVGSVHDWPGQIPPNGYGVHADPVAALLRAYGLPAEAIISASVEDIKREIAAGQPVIAWVITGTVPGYAMTYTTLAGEEVIVAPNEHTVIVFGYDLAGVTILDGGWVYWRSWDEFLNSFGVLGNMAIFYR